VTSRSAAHGIPQPAPVLDGPAVASSRAVDLLPRLCTACGAVGTHYLTCPSLRLPLGYRLSADPEPECRHGLDAGTCRVCA
jgi:hypothetical protein